MRSIRLGNVVIDAKVEGEGGKIALELKTLRNDITRGIGQLAEVLAYGYDQVVLVTTLRNTKSIDSAVFDHFGMVLLGIDSKGVVTCVSYARDGTVQIRRTIKLMASIYAHF